MRHLEGDGLMTSRERFLAAAFRFEADRSVFDLEGSPQTQIDDPGVRDALIKHLNCENFDGVLKYFKIDTRRVGGMPTPDTRHCRVENGIHYSQFGIGYKNLNGYSEICRNPLREKNVDEAMEFELPDAKNIDKKLIEHWTNEAKLLRETTDYAIVAEHPVFGIFEIGCWMFGFDDYLYRLAAEPETVHAFSRRFLKYQLDVIDIYYGAVGRYIDCTTSGDDFGTQAAPFFSLAMFGEYIKPYLKERIERTNKYTDAAFKHHTCGSVHSFIPGLIDCGVDILNPIQPNAYMMEPERLKKDFGDRISFWGGVDTQRLLPEGNANEIKSEVKRLLSIFGDTGYILSPAHCIQKDVPPQSVAAIYEAAEEYYTKSFSLV